MKESSVKAVLGLAGELPRNVDELASIAGTTFSVTESALHGGFEDVRLADAGALRGLSLAVLALLFVADFGANLSSKTNFAISSARGSEGSGKVPRATSVFDDNSLANVGVGRGLWSVAVDGRLLLLPSREEPGRLNGSSRRGGIINGISRSTTYELGTGAVEGLWSD